MSLPTKTSRLRQKQARKKLRIMVRSDTKDRAETLAILHGVTLAKFIAHVIDKTDRVSPFIS